MNPVALIMGIGWVVFWIGWLVAAFTAKQSRGGYTRFSLGRIGLLVLAAFLIRSNWRHGGVAGPHVGPVLTGVGLALWVAGLGLAVWARLYIGRNWGMPMTRRAEPDLVTTGPYRFVRHPIYSGILLGLIGTSLAITLWGLIAAALVGAFFAYSATREEKFLTGQFPDSYPAYKTRTKMLVPFIF